MLDERRRRRPFSALFFRSLLPRNRLQTASSEKNTLFSAARARRKRHLSAPKCPVPLSKVFCSPSPPPRQSKKKTNLSPRNHQVLVAQKVATGVYKGVTTTELDELAAETAASMTATHPDYAVVSIRGAGEEVEERFAREGERSRRRIRSLLLSLSLLFLSPRAVAAPRASSDSRTSLTHSLDTQLAARIAVSNLHKNTLKSFSET